MTQPSLPGGLHVVGQPRAGACGTWWRARASNGAERGVLRLDGAVDAAAARRVADAVRAVNALGFSGFLPTGEPVRHEGALWLVTTQPASPTLIELAEAGVPGIDIGSVATMANETAQSLLELHAAGLAHGFVHGHTVVVSSAGAARLVETAVAPALRGTPMDAAAAALDRQAWAELVRGMVTRWGGDGPGAELLLRCAALGEQDLTEALQALRAGVSALPADFSTRAKLVAAVAAFDGVRVPAAEPALSVPDDPHETYAGTTAAPAAAAPVAEATRLARRPPGAQVVGPEAAAGPPAQRGGGEVRFGRGVEAAAPSGWRRPPTAPARPRRSPWRVLSSVLSSLLTIALLAAVGWYLWQRINPLEVTSVTVAVPEPPGEACDVTVDVVATVQTNGNAGTLKYQWLRSGEPSGSLSEQVARGQRTVTLHLKWSFSGVGTTTETAKILINEPTPAQGETTFTYSCAGQ